MFNILVLTAEEKTSLLEFLQDKDLNPNLTEIFMKANNSLEVTKVDVSTLLRTALAKKSDIEKNLARLEWKRYEEGLEDIDKSIPTPHLVYLRATYFSVVKAAEGFRRAISNIEVNPISHGLSTIELIQKAMVEKGLAPSVDFMASVRDKLYEFEKYQQQKEAELNKPVLYP